MEVPQISAPGNLPSPPYPIIFTLGVNVRSLAFSLLDVLIGDDHNNKRLAHLSQKGFIRHCLDAFNQEQDTMSFIFSADDGTPIASPIASQQARSYRGFLTSYDRVCSCPPRGDCV